MLKDVQLSNLLDIPIQTLQEWKKDSSRRKKLYEFLKSFEEKDVQKRLDAIEALKSLNS